MKRLLATAMILVLAAAGCGGGSDHNVEDSLFVKNMAPHHQQAVVMSDLATAQASTPAVKDLAARIKAAQVPELTSMRGWLSSWNESEAGDPGSSGGMGGMDMGGGPQGAGQSPGMQGMVSELDLSKLRSASGTAFDRLYLELMTAHHRGAVGMAKSEIERGKFEPAKSLARQIISGQENEIAEMAQLLASLPA